MTTCTAEHTRSEIELHESSASLKFYKLSVIDSIVELTPRDTLRRVRFVRLTASESASDSAASLALRRDSTAAVAVQIDEQPLLAESNKRGHASLCAIRILGCVIVFLLFFAFCSVILKFYVFLRDN